MLTYYYHKNHYGREMCYALEEDEIQADKELTLEKLCRDELYPIEMATREYLICNPELKEQIRASGLKFPLYIVTRLSGENEIYQTEEEINLDELIAEYASTHDFKIPPCYYREDEITEELAEKMGAYKLADEVRQPKFAVKNVTENEIVRYCYTKEEAEEEIEGLVDLDQYDGIYQEYAIITL